MLRHFSKFNLPSINSITAIFEANRANVKVCERSAVKTEKKDQIRFFSASLEKQSPPPAEFQQNKKKQFLQFKKTAASKRLKGVLLFDDVF